MNKSKNWDLSHRNKIQNTKYKKTKTFLKNKFVALGQHRLYWEFMALRMALRLYWESITS